MSVSKRQENIASLEQRQYLISEALNFFQASPKVKFNESIDTAINLGIDPERAFQAEASGGFSQGVERFNVNPWVVPIGFKVGVTF